MAKGGTTSSQKLFDKLGVEIDCLIAGVFIRIAKDLDP